MDYAPVSGRLPSDLSDVQWGFLEPLLPAPRHLRRPRPVSLRRVLNAILFIATTGCQWRQLPDTFPQFTTVQYYFYQWRGAHIWRGLNNSLVMMARDNAGREASPSAGVMTVRASKVIPPFLFGFICRTHAAICIVICYVNFWAGVMPPRPMLGRSLLYVRSHCVAASCTSLIVEKLYWPSHS
jgi:transposase